MIFVLIPTYNRLSCTKKCINSLVKTKFYRKIRIIIIDDGSKDSTVKYVQKNYPEIVVLKGDGSFYWTKCINTGIKYLQKRLKKKDHILLVNNDIIFNKNSIDNLYNVIEKQFQRKAIGSSLLINNKNTILYSGSIVKSWFLNITKHVHKGLKLKDISSIEPVNVDFLPARSLLIPAELFSKVGLFNQKKFPHYGADDEFSARVRKFGYACIVCPSSVIISQTLKKKTYSFYENLFGINSSNNIINKFNLTIAVVPFLYRFSYFCTGVIKSIFSFVKND
jgi:GT2 family glycosyltransferase